MRMIRNKMVEARRAEDKQQAKDAILVGRQIPKTWKGDKLIQARDFEMTRPRLSLSWW